MTDCDLTTGTCPRCGFVSKHGPDLRINCPLAPRQAVALLPVRNDLPGSELHAVLSALGLRFEPGCSCQRHIAQMDASGADWCEANLETIVGWLREEWQRRKDAGTLPLRFAVWSDFAARNLVKLALRRARKAAAAGS